MTDNVDININITDVTCWTGISEHTGFSIDCEINDVKNFKKLVE